MRLSGFSPGAACGGSESRLAHRRSRRLALLALAGAAVAHAQPIDRLGAIGDSLTDEYFEEAFAYARAWPELLVEQRGVSMGPLAAALEVGSWGEPRRTGYEDNWARFAATLASAIAAGQHTGLADGVLNRDVSHAVVCVGANDFAPVGAAWAPIYGDVWGPVEIDAWIAARLDELRTLLDAVLPTGVRLVLADVPDATASPTVRAFFPDVAGRERMAAAVELFGAAVRELAIEKGVVYFDAHALTRALYGSNSAPREELLVGDVAIDLDAADTAAGDDPLAAWLHDGVHPNTVVQGITANGFLEALNRHGAGLALFTEAELLAHAGLGYGGSDTLEAQVGPIACYVEDHTGIFTDGFECGDLEAWSTHAPLP